MAEPDRQQPIFDAPLMQVPPAPTAKPSAPPPAQVPAQSIFVSDRPSDSDVLGPTPALSRLAELIAHRDAEGPFTVALIGGPGTGKSRALGQVLADAAALSRGAGGKASPYLPGLVEVRLTASELGANPAAAIAERLHGALATVAPEIAAQAADEANHSAVDPHARLQSLTESLDTSRRRLDAERRARDDAESRRARLVETILYESAGSRVDAYARANRAGIESALASFGFTKGDPLATYKDLVRTLTDAGGPAARAFASLKSLWAYPGQMKRIVWAVLFFALAWGCGALSTNQSWITSVDAQGETLHSVATWLHAHVGWLGIARQLSFLAGFLCLASCAWRALRFSRFTMRGASLVDADLDVRRGELDNLVAHHAQRVEALSGETDTLARRTMEAEKRLGGARPTTPAFLASGGDDNDRSRRTYLANVDAALARGAKGADRIVVAIDDLDAVPPASVMTMLEGTASVLRSPRFALVAAFDADRILRAHPENEARLDRLVQVPFRVDGDASGWSDIVSRLVASRAPATSRAFDATRSALAAPLHDAEQQLLATLAPLAGPSPRGVKRFVNLYRLGRGDATDGLAAFAFALALHIGGTDAERAAFNAMLQGGTGTAAIGGSNAVGRLRPTLDALAALVGGPLTVDQARHAHHLAGRWSLKG